MNATILSSIDTQAGLDATPAFGVPRLGVLFAAACAFAASMLAYDVLHPSELLAAHLLTCACVTGS